MRLRDTIPGAALGMALLTGCTPASGPGYSVTTYDSNDHAPVYRVACQGLFASFRSCEEAAARVCGDRQVLRKQTESTLPGYPEEGRRRPSRLTFECSADKRDTPASGADAGGDTADE